MTSLTDLSHTLYTQSINSLVGSFIIKHDSTARIVNKYLKEIGVEVDDDNPRTWKYYMHLNGEYHSTDEVMTVISIDTLETIVFSKSTLAEHKTTASEYAYGTDYYKELVSRYPTQSDLIKGILKPTSFDTAYKSPDWTILQWDTSLVEPAETSLMSDLQDVIYRYTYRWYNPGYELEELYHHDFIVKVLAVANMAVYNLRLAATHTNSAHSFHIWSYLASNGKFDEYREYLTDEQRLFLYRNIKYLMANAGSASTLDTMIEKFFTARNIPAYGYELIHDIDDFMEGYKPETKYIRKALNPPISTDNDEVTFTTYDLLLKESNLARNNDVRRDEDEADIIRRSKYSRSDYLPTRIIETSVIDNEGSEEITIATVLFNEWLHLSAAGYYNGTVQISNPFIGDVMQVSPLDAFNLYVYFWCRSWNRDIGNEYIPKQIAHDVFLFKNKPTNEHRSMFKAMSHLTDLDVDFIFDNQPILKKITNLTDFTSLCEDMLRQHRTNAWRINKQENLNGRIQQTHLTKAFYGDILVDPNPKGETFDEMITRLGYTFNDLTYTDFDLLMFNTLEATLGDILGDSSSLVNIQKAMVDIVKNLSSYTLQFIYQGIDTVSKNVAFNMPMLDSSNVIYTIDGGDALNPETVELSIKHLDTHITASADMFSNDNTEGTHNTNFIYVHECILEHDGYFQPGGDSQVDTQTYLYDNSFISEK